MSDVISLNDRRANIDRGRQVYDVQQTLHEFFKTENIPPEIAQTALMCYCARVAVRVGTSKRNFVLAAKKVYAEIAKELRE